MMQQATQEEQFRKQAKPLGESGPISAGHTQTRKKTTDELIEEYERKINNTKSLLEEEKEKLARKAAKVRKEYSPTSPA